MIRHSSATVFVAVSAITFLHLSQCIAAESGPESDQASPENKATSNEAEKPNELSEVEKQIAAKNDELAALRQKADELRAKDAPSTIKGVRQLQKFLISIPKELQPRGGGDEESMFARDRANKWLEGNLIGKTLEFTDHIKVKISPTTTPGQYSGQVSLEESKARTRSSATGTESILMNTSIGSIRSGGAEWKVNYVFPAPVLSKKDIDEAAAKRLMRLNGKSVTITGKVIKSSGRSHVRTSSGTFGGTVISPVSAIYGDLFYVVRRSSSQRIIRDRTGKLVKADDSDTEPMLTLHLGDVSVKGLDSP